MNYWITFWPLSLFFAGLLVLAGRPALAQQVPKTYFLDGDEVVFEFDSRIYTRAIKDQTGEELDFADLNIEEVIVSGAFNNWSKEGWHMKKVGRHRYQLRKKLEDFNDEFTWDFKFLVNGQYWIEPSYGKMSGKMLSNDFLEEVYQLDLYDLKTSANGNALFQLAGFEDASEVVLAGSFNGWNERQLKMYRVEDGWQVRLDLSPGRYEYKFIVDRNWLHDPANPDKIRNEHGTFNSVRYITRTVHFKLEGFPDARRVILAGSFNNWNETKTRMAWEDGAWQINLDLLGGKHYYKFIVDGQWMTDPRNPIREKDRHGHVNSVLFVR